MKSEERHQLEQNELADWMTRLVGNIVPYLKYMVAGLAVVVVVAVASSYLTQRDQAKQAEAWDDFFGVDKPDQYEVVIERYPNMAVVPYAKIRIADQAYQEGQTKLVSDRDEAIAKFDQAIKLYEELISDTSAPEIAIKAAYGIGAAQESKGALKKAQEAYQRVVDSYPGTTYALMAQERLKQIETPEAKAFYEQLASYQPPATNFDLPPKTDDPLPGLDAPSGSSPAVPPPPKTGADSKKATKPMLEFPDFEKVDVPAPPKPKAAAPKPAEPKEKAATTDTKAKPAETKESAKPTPPSTPEKAAPPKASEKAEPKQETPPKAAEKTAPKDAPAPVEKPAPAKTEAAPPKVPEKAELKQEIPPKAAEKSETPAKK